MLNFNALPKTIRQSTAALSVAVVALAGLTTSAHAGDYNAVLGAGVGAVAGAVIGQHVGGRQGAVIGGAAGAVLGANMGNASANHGSHGGGRVLEQTRVYYPPQRPAHVMVVSDYRRMEPYGGGRNYSRHEQDFRHYDRHHHGRGHGYGYGHDKHRD